MNKYRILLYIGVCLCIGCAKPESERVVNVDLENRISLEKVNEYLLLDSLVLISSEEYAVVSFDRMIRRGDNIYVLDKIQEAVFRINTATRSLQRIIYCKGSAQNEYITITDIAMDESDNIYVFDSDSRKINQYNVDGKFLKTIKANCGTSITIVGDKLAITTNQLEDFQVAVYSISGELLYHAAPYRKQTYPYSVDNIGSIIQSDGKFLYTTPYDFNIYQVDESELSQYVSLDFGDRQFNTQELEGLDYKSYLNLLMSSAKKIIKLNHLHVADGLLFLSTDTNEQLIYDTNENVVVVVSNAETPYNILFSTPISVSTDGTFCVALDDSNIRNGYFPWFKANKTKLPQLQSTQEGASTDNSFWLLMGHIR